MIFLTSEWTDGRPHENDAESAPVKPSDPVEKASLQGIECGHGGPDYDQLVCDARQLSLPERTDLVEIRKDHRPRTFDAALGRELHEVIQEAKKMASQIKGPSDLWELEHYLTERRKEIDRKYDYRYSRLTHVFGKLLYEKRLSEEELRGLREEKLNSIRSVAQFLAEDAA
jgi:hypothetical protein